jgi:3-oxosteroid 1-dehydrogenase
MIEEGIRIGAATAQLDTRIGMQISRPPGFEKLQVKPAMQNDVCKPHAIVVDERGQRFVNEASSHAEFTHRLRKREQKHPGMTAWMVVDQQFLDTYMLAGTMPGKKKPEAWAQSKFLRSAASIEALARECGIDPTELGRTVQRYNGFVRDGRDPEFKRGDAPYDRWTGDPLHRPSTTLGAIEKAPFHAVQLHAGDVGTYGGLLTDAHARVLREDGQPIPGLYATGTSTASVMGPVEPGPGGSVGPSLTWGYVAARHALAARS